MVRVGARDSRLSVIQTEHLLDQLRGLGMDVEVVYSKSLGDQNQITPVSQMNRDGVFTSHLESLLLQGEVDIAVHSMKDLPTVVDDKIITIPVLPREDPRDVLLIKSHTIKQISDPPLIHPYTRIATSSVRRKNQLKQLYHDALIVDLRGNIDTRIRKLIEGWFDGLVISKAALNRFPHEFPPDIKEFILPIHLFPTSPAQGQLAVQIRKEDRALKSKLMELLSPEYECVELERKIFSHLGFGCISPIGITIEHGIDYRLHLYDGRSPHSISRIYGKPIPNPDEYTFTSPQKIAPSPPISAKIVITKSEEHPLTHALLKSGVDVFCVPVVHAIPSLCEDQFPDAEWVILTSPRSVNYLPSSFTSYLRRKKIAVVGSRTADVAHAKDIPVHYASKVFNSVSLVDELFELDSIKSIAVIGGDHISPELMAHAEKKKIKLEKVQVYTSVYEVSSSLLKAVTASIDPETYVLSTSRKISETLLQAEPSLSEFNWIVYSERSKDALIENGVHSVRVVRPGDIPQILEIVS